MQGIFLLAEDLSVSQEGLCSMYKACPNESGTDKFMQRFI
jgi:hypothetical protein